MAPDVSTSKQPDTYKLLLPKNLLSFFSQLNLIDGRFPAIRVSAHFDSHSSPYNLMPKTDADNSHAVLRQHFGGVIYQGLNPRTVVKRVMP